MARKLFSALILVVMVSSASAQKISYRDAKKTYVSQYVEHEKYSPIAAGVLNYLFVGAGHIYVGEPLRGLGFFAGEVAAFSCGLTGLVMYMGSMGSTDKTLRQAQTLMITGIGTSLLIHVWSIVDVIHVANVKNVAYSQQSNLSFQAKPFIEYTSYGPLNSKLPALGLTLSLKF